jgi:2'-5' RNA ligase
MAQSAFIVRVPEAEPFVARLRERFDPVARLGVPAHVTVLFPFLAPERVSATILEQARAILSSARTFEFRLVRVERFPAALYLAPEPAAPFVALTERLARQFPECPPYGGAFDSVIPHLTVAHGSSEQLDEAERELRAGLPSPLALASTCTSVSLIENSSGLWRPLHEFTLARP